MFSKESFYLYESIVNTINDCYNSDKDTTAKVLTEDIIKFNNMGMLSLLADALMY